MSESGVKKYVVRLAPEERARLEEVISKGKRPAVMIRKARILLKADISNAGEGWSDGRIAKALDTSLATVHRVRQRLVEEGLDATLARKPRVRPSIPRIFDGENEARLITLAGSQPPAGHAKWSLRLLEQTVVERGIVARASDNTIGRTLKKRSQTAPEAAMGHSADGQCGVRGGDGRRAGGLHKAARSGPAFGLSGRDLAATDPGNPDAGADETRPSATRR